MNNVEKELISNYLDRQHYKRGIIFSLGFIIVCFLFSFYFWHLENISASSNDFLIASPSNLFIKKEWWVAFTTTFLHADLGHLLSNSFMLFIMGYFVSSYYGPLVHPVLSFIIGGGLCNYIVLSTLEKNTSLLGASGVVYYLWGVWQVLYLFIQRHLTLNRRLMKVTAVNLFLLFPSYFDPHISYLAHATGFLLGTVSGALIFFMKKNFFYAHEIYVWRWNKEE